MITKTFNITTYEDAVWKAVKDQYPDSEQWNYVSRGSVEIYLDGSLGFQWKVYRTGVELKDFEV